MTNTKERPEIYSLDIETAPMEPTDKPYALEPYRITSGQAEITAVSVWGPEGLVACLNYKIPDFHEQMKSLLNNLSGKEVYAHNAIFDVSFLIAQYGIEIIRPIKWRDTIILNKWLCNGQKAEEIRLSYSLMACASRYCRDHPKLGEFLDLKKQVVTPGEDFEYWLYRNQLDVEITYSIAMYLLDRLKPEIQRGYIVTCNSIVPIAEGYVLGIPINTEVIDEYERAMTGKQKIILSKLDIDGSVITSTKQLSNLLFDTWDLTPQGLTPKGMPSTSAENLLRLHQASNDPRLDMIMDYKKMATMQSKYILGFRRSFSHNQSNRIHGQPKLLSTITGRMTYTTKLFKKNEFQTSIALHQLPRKEKEIKRAMVSPKGYKILYMDFSAQEGRVMAIMAPEPTMIESYNIGIDLHSDLTEDIFGTPYDTIVKANNDGKPDDIVEQRQAGKLTGLSSFYRIGAKALAGKFFITYGYNISISIAQSYLTSFKRKYPGVVRYWTESIRFARRNKYAEAFGGWRYRIHSFDWKGESSAINHPIQGGGSMLTYAAIGIISKRNPENILVSQVHDSLAYFIPEENADENARDLLTYLNNYNYGALLGFDQTVPLIFDGGIGDNFADLKTIVL